MGTDAMFDPIDPAEAARSDAAGPAEFQPMAPPAGLEKDEIRHYKLGKPSCIWPYHDAGGDLDGYVCRFDLSSQDGTVDKEFRPYRYGATTKNGQTCVGWCWKGWGDGRPLYNLRELLARLDARVIVTEGEKKAAAAKQLFPDCVAVSPMNGAKSPHKTDWSPLAGRSLVIWPDNDQPGRDFAEASVKLARAAGASEVAVVAVPQGWPQKWDLADARPDGVEIGTLTDLLNSAKPRPDRRLKEPASEEEIIAEVHRLAAVSPVKYVIEREASAEKLGIGVSALDRLVKRERGVGDDALKPGQGRPVEIPEVEPWPEKVGGVALLEELARAIREYVVLSPRQADAVALWILFTHTFEAFDFSPKLVISSPEKRSGKTRLVEVAERLTRRPLFVSGISPAALLRIIEQAAPAMLIDEIDTSMKGDVEMAEALRGLINSGFSRAGARIIKNVPSPDGGFEPRAFSTWCPTLLAGIGKLPDTVADRSITIHMARKRPDEKVRRLRTRDGSELQDLARRAARWAVDNFDAIKRADPEALKQLNDRAADAWSPLLAVADRVGGKWPERARKAAIELSGDDEGAETTREVLLSDLRELFDVEPSGTLFTREIIAALHKREDRPWSEWKAGKPITGRQVAALLKPLGVKTNQTVRRGIEHDKGYRIEWFEDAFTRYLPLSIGDTVTNEGIRSSRATSIGDAAPPDVTDTNRKKPSISAECHRVTDPIPPFGSGKANGADPDRPPTAPDDPSWMVDGADPAPPDRSKPGRVTL